MKRWHLITIRLIEWMDCLKVQIIDFITFYAFHFNIWAPKVSWIGLDLGGLIIRGIWLAQLVHLVAMLVRLDRVIHVRWVLVCKVRTLVFKHLSCLVEGIFARGCHRWWHLRSFISEINFFSVVVNAWILGSVMKLSEEGRVPKFLLEVDIRASVDATFSRWLVWLYDGRRLVAYDQESFL